MILAVDDTIPYWEEAFAPIGEVRPFAAGALRPVDVRDADALLVRSTLWISAALLEGSTVRFVGTASAGMDHLDADYLSARGIHFTNAAGCNAKAVAEYTGVLLSFIAERQGWDLAKRSLAIIGVGQVGSRVESLAYKLGMKVLPCDPPLRDSTGNARFLSLQEVLDADILTFHVPLTRSGLYPTYHMVDGALLDRLSHSPFLVNSARGAVCDSEALKKALHTQRLAGAALDVWENEPGIDYELLDLVELGTPHIAGFSQDGKIRATEMVAEQLCAFFNVTSHWDSREYYPRTSTIRPTQGSSDLQVLQSILRQAYDIARDDKCLRELRSLGSDQAAAAFERIRSEYPLRPEFHHFRVEMVQENIEQLRILQALGFQVTSPTSTPGVH